MIKATTQSKKGFTLVETLVAIAILLVTIMGPFYSLQQAIMSAYVSRDKLIAGALAQEGVEFVRVIRDNNYHTRPMPWLAGMDGSPDADSLHSADCISASNLCLVDPAQDTITTCTGASCTPLNLSGANRYTHGAGTPTKFYRTVKLTTVNANEEKVTVTVAWRNSVATTTVVVTGELYNWQ